MKIAAPTFLGRHITPHFCDEVTGLVSSKQSYILICFFILNKYPENFNLFLCTVTSIISNPKKDKKIWIKNGKKLTTATKRRAKIHCSSSLF